MTQSNALPLIRLHGSHPAQESHTPRRGLVLPRVHAQRSHFRPPYLGHLWASTPSEMAMQLQSWFLQRENHKLVERDSTGK